MADQYITFINRPTPIEDIVTDMKLYFADNGKSRSKCKLFDNTGFAGLPDDAYSMADLRMNIQLGDTTSEDVVFSVDVIMEDGSYLSEVKPNYAKIQMPYEQAIKLNEITWARDIVKPLIARLQKYEDDNGAPEKETCKSIIINNYSALGDKETLQGANARNLAQLLVKYITSDTTLARGALFNGHTAKSKEYANLYKALEQNIAIAIESDNEIARNFFKKYPLNKKPKSRPNFINAYSAEFPKLSKDDLAKVQNSKKKLNKSIDEPDELLAAFARHATDNLYKTKFIQALKDKRDTASGDMKKVYTALYNALTALNNAD